MSEIKNKYTLDKNGNRIRTKEYSQYMYDTLFGDLRKNIEVSQDEAVKVRKLIRNELAKTPKHLCFISKYLIYNTIFSSILDLLYTNGYKANIHWKLISTSEATNIYVNDGTFQDPSSAYSEYDVLFVVVNYEEIKNYLNPHMINNLAKERDRKNKRTYFFFLGTKSDMLSDKWLIRDDSRSTVGKSLYGEINTVDLNKRLDSIIKSVEAKNNIEVSLKNVSGESKKKESSDEEIIQETNNSEKPKNNKSIERVSRVSGKEFSSSDVTEH